MTGLLSRSNKKYSIRGLLRRLNANLEGSAYLATAAKTGWLTDGVFATRLTTGEVMTVQEMVRQNTIPVRSHQLHLPTITGPLVVKAKAVGQCMRLITTAGATTLVDAKLYYTLRHRHPKAKVYLWGDDLPAGEKMPIIFSEVSAVAMLAPAL